jgi:4-hydroxybenzoate polyprenyltransferase
VTATGNIINDIFDIEADAINNRKRPIALGEVSVKNANLLYILLVIFSVGFASFVSYRTSSWWLVLMEIVIIYMLFLYAKHLKGVAILGNLLVSLLVSLSFLILILIELPIQLDHYALNWILFYGIFAFWCNLNREIIKDLQDIKGDYFQKHNTLPILIGRSRTHTVLFLSTSLLIIAIVVGVKNYLLARISTFIYFIFGVCVPLIFIAYRLYRFQDKVNYNRLSKTYKFVILLGLLSMLIL